MTERPPLDLATARRLAREVVEAQGRDFVYNPDGKYACYYKALTEPELPWVNPDPEDPRYKTGCYVGRVFDAYGEIRHHGDDGDQQQTDVAGLLEEYPGLADDAAAAYLAELQRHQDQGLSWGTAYDMAEVWLREEMGEE